MLERPEMEQLAQRVIARYHLDALSEPETAQYIQHRLKVAGLVRGPLFDADAVRRVHRWTRGVPRRINLLCDRALLGAYAENQVQVNVAIVDKAAAEVFPRAARQRALAAAQSSKARAPATRRMPWVWGGLAALGLTGVGAALWLQQSQAPRAASGAVPQVALAAAASGVASAASGSSVSATAPLSAPPSTLVSAEQLMQAAWPDEDAALQALMTHWQVAAVPAQVCQNAWRQGLLCHQQSGGLAQIRQLDRPVVLRLQAGSQSRHVVLTGLHEREAQLQAGEQTVSMSLSTLGTLWRGDFLTLWRTPPDYKAKLLRGQRNAAVGWVAQRLAQLDGHPLPTSDPTHMAFDGALEAQVQAFQLTQGLAPDGVVGATTLMQLNRATGVAEPRLATASHPLPSPPASQPAHVLHP